MLAYWFPVAKNRHFIYNNLKYSDVHCAIKLLNIFYFVFEPSCKRLSWYKTVNYRYVLILSRHIYLYPWSRRD